MFVRLNRYWKIVIKRVFNNLCVLVATKDRPTLLQNLLDSISNSTFLPAEVVIVYHGIDISEKVSEFEEILNIRIINSDIANQSIQKSIGIKYIDKKFDWVLFIDDDLILQSNTLEFLMTNYVANKNFNNFAGFGLNILNNKYTNYNLLAKFILICFSLYSRQPGSITKSGHPQPYMNQENDTEVDWLNGTSLWNSEFLNFYKPTQSPLSYAAYEDVCFSYQVRKHSKLLFVRKANVFHQQVIEKKSFTFQQYFSSGYFRYYFVTVNNFSKIWLLISQVIRSIDFILQYKSFPDVIRRAILAKKLWFVLLSLSRRNIHGEKIWSEKLFIPD